MTIAKGRLAAASGGCPNSDVTTPSPAWLMRLLGSRPRPEPPGRPCLVGPSLRPSRWPQPMTMLHLWESWHTHQMVKCLTSRSNKGQRLLPASYGATRPIWPSNFGSGQNEEEGRKLCGRAAPGEAHSAKKYVVSLTNHQLQHSTKYLMFCCQALADSVSFPCNVRCRCKSYAKPVYAEGTLTAVL